MRDRGAIASSCPEGRIPPKRPGLRRGNPRAPFPFDSLGGRPILPSRKAARGRGELRSFMAETDQIDLKQVSLVAGPEMQGLFGRGDEYARLVEDGLRVRFVVRDGKLTIFRKRGLGGAGRAACRGAGLAGSAGTGSGRPGGPAGAAPLQPEDGGYVPRGPGRTHRRLAEEAFRPTPRVPDRPSISGPCARTISSSGSDRPGPAKPIWPWPWPSRRSFTSRCLGSFSPAPPSRRGRS